MRAGVTALARLLLTALPSIHAQAPLSPASTPPPPKRQCAAAEESSPSAVRALELQDTLEDTAAATTPPPSPLPADPPLLGGDELPPSLPLAPPYISAQDLESDIRTHCDRSVFILDPCNTDKGLGADHRKFLTDKLQKLGRVTALDPARDHEQGIFSPQHPLIKVLLKLPLQDIGSMEGCGGSMTVETDHAALTALVGGSQVHLAGGHVVDLGSGFGM